MNFRTVFKFNIQEQIEHEKEIQLRTERISQLQLLAQLLDEAANYEYQNDNLGVEEMVARVKNLDLELTFNAPFPDTSEAKIQRAAYQEFLKIVEQKSA
jgi:hypothetical protein